MIKSIEAVNTALTNLRETQGVSCLQYSKNGSLNILQTNTGDKVFWIEYKALRGKVVSLEVLYNAGNKATPKDLKEFMASVKPLVNALKSFIYDNVKTASSIKGMTEAQLNTLDVIIL